jgi:hypothetical protein
MADENLADLITARFDRIESKLDGLGSRLDKLESTLHNDLRHLETYTDDRLDTLEANLTEHLHTNLQTVSSQFRREIRSSEKRLQKQLSEVFERLAVLER